jgi:RNase H-fold protein (predicted Holliday junction resolvase)
MQDSAFEFESFNQFSSEAGSTGSTGASAVRFGPGATVVLVGDSHTVGAFGSELERLLKATGASIVRSAEKGTAVKQWLGRLPQLLKKHAPNIVIVALGANMRGYPYPRATSAQVTKLIAVIRKERPGAALYWIGPPRKRSDTTATLTAFNAILKNGLGSSARFVDSSPHTPKYEGGDGEHYAPAPAKRWAKGVFVELTGAAPRVAPSKAAPPATAAPAKAPPKELGEWETEVEWELPPPTGACSAEWIAFTKKLRPDAKSALEVLDFAGAVAAAIRGGVVSEFELTKMLFYTKYGPTHGYCAVKSGTRIPGGDSYQKAWADLQRDYVAPGLAAAPAPVLSLKGVRVGSAAMTRPRYLGSGVYQGWYVSRADARVRAGIPQSRLVEITGRLQIAELGTRRNYDPKKDKLWSLRGAEVSAVPLTTPSDTARSGFASVMKLAKDGSFRTSTVVGFDGFPHPFRLQVAARLANGKVFRTRLELSPVQIDLERFLSIVGPKEGAVRQSRLEFVASVRKIYQGGPGDPLAGAFDFVLYRNRGVRVLFEQEPAMRTWLKAQEAIYADGELVDIGHVLAGIEGASKQRPSEDQQIPVPVRPDLIVTWAGDLGSVLQHNMAGIVAAVAQNQTPKWEEYLKRAPRSDLVGDIDGVNLGSLYDPNDSLTGNLKAYYGKKSARRFHEFVANTLDIKGKPALPLVVTDKPPRLSEAAWTFLASSVLSYLAPFWITGKLEAGVAPANYPLIDRILDPKSPEIRAVVAHFVRFLESGLEREIWAAP